MLESPFDVDAVLGRAVENPCRRNVDDEANGAYRQHQQALDFRYVGEAMVCLEQHPDDDQPEGKRVQKSGQDLKATIAISALCGNGLFGEVHSEQGESDGYRVRQHVPRIGEERQAAGEDADDDLGEHVADDQHESSGQATLARPSKLVGMVVPAEEVVMVVIVVVMAAIVVAMLGIVAGHRNSPPICAY